VAERNPETGRFEKGHQKLGGMKAGYAYLDVRAVISGAIDKLGGINRLVQWVNADKENERIFWSEMYMKLLPVSVNATGNAAVLVINPDEIDKALEERGLPQEIFGRDAPTLELTAEEVGNGKDPENGSAAGPEGKGLGGNGRDETETD